MKLPDGQMRFFCLCFQEGSAEDIAEDGLQHVHFGELCRVRGSVFHDIGNCHVKFSLRAELSFAKKLNLSLSGSEM